jgi:hypothetical protein
VAALMPTCGHPLLFDAKQVSDLSVERRYGRAELASKRPDLRCWCERRHPADSEASSAYNPWGRPSLPSVTALRSSRAEVSLPIGWFRKAPNHPRMALAD